jgi:serine/threonine-protein kinase
MRGLTPELWRRLGPLLDEVFEAPASRRAGLASSLSGGDPDLRAELLDLAAAAERAGILDVSADSLLRGPDDDTAEGAASGERIGPWRVLGEIGRGGMGIVYLAERADGAFQQRAALKLLRRGIDTDEVLERFGRERQILARLEHVHIARLLDGGATAAGRPYLVMEFVEGEPITAWCDARRSGVEHRLRLFLDVCAAVEHAHRRLVVHRDLKPSNILVTAAGEAKLLDFGIAKLLGSGEEDFVTHVGRRVMTPRYAAPEQVQGEPITTATDTYALGLVLYELLAGRSPYRMPRESEGELQRAVLEREPEAPSSAVFRSEGLAGLRPEDIAAARATTPERLRGRLRGDLDAILLTALRKERDRRYPSAESLARDVERHLAMLPISARADTFGYRSRRFLRRHRTAAAAGALVALSLLAGLSATAWQAREAARESDRATRVSEFLTELFIAADPTHLRGDTISAREILDRGAERIESELSREPALQGKLLSTMGHAYWGLGDTVKAEQLLARAVELQTRTEGPDDPATLFSLNQLANMLVRNGRHNEGIRAFREALKRRRRVLGTDHADTLRSMNDLAFWSGDGGRHGEAIALHREVIERRSRVLGPEHYDTLWSTNDLAVALGRVGRYREAEALLLDALATWRRSDISQEPDAFMENLADAYHGQERYEEAEALIGEVLEIRRRLFGDEHPQTLSAIRNQATLDYEQGRGAEGAALLTEVLEQYRRLLGPDHYETLATMSHLARAYGKQGRYAEAEELARETIERQRRTLGPRHSATTASMYVLACVRGSRGHREAALRALREAVAAGYPNGPCMSRDVDLRTLHGDPEFERLVAAARQNAEETPPVAR